MPTVRELMNMTKRAIPGPNQQQSSTIQVSDVLSGFVTEWNAFNMARLEAKYGHVLSDMTDEHIRSIDELPAGNDVAEKEHFINWTGCQLQTTAGIGIQRMYPNAGIRLSNRHIGPERRDDMRIAQLHSRSLRHHVVAIDRAPREVLIVGIGKAASAWSGQMYFQAHSRRFLTPVYQLYVACRAAGTRYGYVQCNTDLTVCRFFHREDGKPGAHVKVIPWEACNQELTTDLAVWWITMEAMEGAERRALLSEQQTLAQEVGSDA